MNETTPIMLVEDDLVDVMAVERGFRELGIRNPLLVAGNGEEALARLRTEGTTLPGLMLLDLNMPRMNGIDLLKVLKGDELLRRIPVVVLSTSKDATDRLKSFDLSVAGYMAKPVEYADFVELLRQIQHYWRLSELPPK